MARSRNIKPGFFKNEMLAELSPLVRLLFAGLWCLADREGRLEDRPKRIRAEVLPYDDGSVDDMLTELHQAGFILRYEADGKRFIQVSNFCKHQHPHHKEPESPIPAPDLPETSPGLTQDLPHSDPADSFNPLTDSLSTDDQDKARASKPDLNGFSECWSAYPKRSGGNSRAEALKAYRARVKAGVSPEDLFAGVQRYAAFIRATGKEGSGFVKQAATFFGPGEHWQELWEPPTETAGIKATSDPFKGAI